MKHHEVTVEEVARVVNGMDAEGFKRLADSLPPASAKHGDRTLGQGEALFNMIRPEDFDRLLAGEAAIRIEEAIRLLVDKNGRCIPQNLTASVCDANRSFRLGQPVMATEADYANRLLKLHGKLGIDTGITAAQFKATAESLLAELAANPRIANLAKGVCLPVVLPKPAVADLGEEVERLAEAVGASYQEASPERAFNDYCRDTLAKQVSLAADSCHDQLLEARKLGPVIALHFPNPLQGFSVNAGREQIKFMPAGLALSGLDTLVAGVMYAETLFRDFHTPGLFLAALCWGSAGYSLCFGAPGGELWFGSTDYLGGASGYYSAGLVFLG